MSKLVIPTPRKVQWYGWRPSLPGATLDVADTAGLVVKPQVDPRRKMPPVFDQLPLGACTANATAAAFEYDALLDGKKTGRLSRLWIYYYERSIEGLLGQGDTGAVGSDAFKVAQKIGIPPETAWPYDISRFEQEPPASAKAAASYFLTKRVKTVPHSLTAVRQVLSNNQTVAFGFTVYESFEQDAKWVDGKMPIPGAREAVLGGHEILVVGYLKADPNYLLCRNSWGKGWMLGGYFLFPLAVFLDPRVCSDFRTIYRPAA